MSSFEKGLVSASNDWSGDITESRIVRGFLVSEVQDILECFCGGWERRVFFRGLVNSRKVLHDVELKQSLGLLDNDFDVPICQDMFFLLKFNQTFTNSGYIHTV